MAGTSTHRKNRSAFGDLLRSELDAQGVSIRELARRLSGEESRVENVRRSLMRYVQGEVMPGVDAREAIADALGIDTNVFAEDAQSAARRDRILAALEPLADVLLEIAVETRDQERAVR
jgi:transcriptional regulator with XRE-family HTH domain